MATMNDTFTGADSTGIPDGAYTADTGESWTTHGTHASEAGSGTDIAFISSNRCRPRSTDTWIWADFSPASADYDVELDLVLFDEDFAGTNDGGVVGRIDTAADTGYVFRYDHNNLQYVLEKWVTGTQTQLDTAASGAFAVETRRLKLEMRGTAIKGYVDDVEVCSATDSDISSAGNPGIAVLANAGGEAGTNYDNFETTDAAGGGGSTTHGPLAGEGGLAGSGGLAGGSGILARSMNKLNGIWRPDRRLLVPVGISLRTA